MRHPAIMRHCWLSMSDFGIGFLFLQNNCQKKHLFKISLPFVIFLMLGLGRVYFYFVVRSETALKELLLWGEGTPFTHLWLSYNYNGSETTWVKLGLTDDSVSFSFIFRNIRVFRIVEQLISLNNAS